MDRFNEDVIVNLLKKGYVIESYVARIMLKLFIAEEYTKRREVLYKLIKDCEYIRSLLKNGIRMFKRKIPAEMEIRYPEFEEMFIGEKMSFLRRIKEVSTDYYRCLLKDLKEAEREVLGEKEKEKLITILERIVKSKEEHLKIIKKMWKME